jgi:hypothetical protein
VFVDDARVDPPKSELPKVGCIVVFVFVLVFPNSGAAVVVEFPGVANRLSVGFGG